MPEYAVFCGHCGLAFGEEAQVGRHGLRADAPNELTIESWQAIRESAGKRRAEAAGAHVGAHAAGANNDTPVGAHIADANDGAHAAGAYAVAANDGVRFGAHAAAAEADEASASAAGEPGATSAPQADVPTPDAAPAESRWARHWKIPAAVLLAVLLAGVLAMAIPLVREQLSMSNDVHRVTFVIRAPGYNDQATPLPVKVEGQLANGSAYAQTTYLDGGGNGIVLEPGIYTLEFPGGSILANGTLLIAPDAKLEVEVPQGLPRNAFVQLPTDQAVEYAAVAPLDTDEVMLNRIYTVAQANPDDHGKAQELRDAALKAHEEAVSKNEEHAAKVQQDATGDLAVSVGDSARFVGTLELCTPEDVSVRLQNDSVQWNFYGRTLAVVWLDEPREVTLQNPEQTGYGWYDDEGDYHEDEVYTERYTMSCLLLNDDVEGVYSYGEGDDGTLSGLAGQRVLVSGKVATPDWSASQISPLVLANPTIEAL